MIHQIQSLSECISIWGEAQAYILQGKIIEELGKSPPVVIRQITDVAYDLGTPGFTTCERSWLKDVRKILVDNSTGSTRLVYEHEPLLPWEIVNRCDP